MKTDISLHLSVTFYYYSWQLDERVERRWHGSFLVRKNSSLFVIFLPEITNRFQDGLA
jgi:hypothetical protein